MNWYEFLNQLDSAICEVQDEQMKHEERQAVLEGLENHLTDAYNNIIASQLAGILP